MAAQRVEAAAGRSAVLGAATSGDLSGALALLEETEPGDPWENAVTAVLWALCRPGDRQAAEAAIDHCHAFHGNEGLAVFTTRLTLSALDAAGPDTPATRNLIEQLASRTGESGDGYALCDLLAHQRVRDRLEPGRTAALERSLAACALSSARLPEPVHDRLEKALTDAEAVLEKSPLDPASPGGDPLEHRSRTAPSSDANRPQHAR